MLFYIAISKITKDELIEVISSINASSYLSVIGDTVGSNTYQAYKKISKSITKIFPSLENYLENEHSKELKNLDKRLILEKEKLKNKSEDELRDILLKNLGKLANIKNHLIKSDGIKTNEYQEEVVKCCGDFLKISKSLPIQNLENLVYEKYIEQVYERIQSELNKFSAEDNERLEKNLNSIITELNTSETNEIKKFTGLDELNANSLINFFKSASIGVGSLMAIKATGFGAYLGLTTILKAFSLTFGLTLSFGAYTTATTLLSWIISPVAVFAILGLILTFSGWRWSRQYYQLQLTNIIVYLISSLRNNGSQKDKNEIKVIGQEEVNSTTLNKTSIWKYYGILSKSTKRIILVTVMSLNESNLFFGKKKIIQIMKGSKDSFTKEYELHEKEYFGILKFFPAYYLDECFDDLISNDLLIQEVVKNHQGLNRPIIRISDKSRKLLSRDFEAN